MYTQCPECLTIYRIPVDALTRAHGRARCGVCRAEFDALATLGFPSDSMVAIGKGSSELLVPTAQGVREPQNRRVEVSLAR